MFGRAPRRLLLPRPQGPSKRWGTPPSTPQPRRVRVTELRRETADALTLVMALEEGPPLAVRAGQYLTHCFRIDGRIVRRAYSLSEPEGGRLACTVKLIPGGWVSAHLQQLQVGSSHEVLGPTGDFVLDDADHGPLRFLAGGSGITPVISLIETALARDAQRDIVLLYASRRTADIIFAARLQRLAQLYSSLRVIHVLSQPDGDWSGERGRLDGTRIVGRLGTEASAYYLCGPAGLMAVGEGSLREAGVAAARLRQERFLAAPQALHERSREPQPIAFHAAGRRVLQQPGETILDAALREGLPLRFSCMVGGCGRCRVQVIDGEVALDEPNCLSPEERAQGYTLACSAFALGPVTLA